MSVSRFSPVAVSYRVTSDPLSSSAALTTRYDWPPSNHFGACGNLAENSPEKIWAIMSLCCACCGTAADTATLRAMHTRVRNGKRTLTQELIFMMSRSPRRYLTPSNGAQRFRYASMRILKPLVFAASISPIAFLLWDALSRPPDIIYFNGIVRSTGYWSVRFLFLALAITPLRWLTGWHGLVKFRRMLGLFGFFYGVVHTAAYVVFDRVFALDAPVRERLLAATEQTLAAIGVDLLRPFFAIGLVALLLIVPLAATSTAGMIRSLGG